MSGTARRGKRGQPRPVMPTRKRLTNASAGSSRPPPARHGTAARPTWVVLAPGSEGILHSSILSPHLSAPLPWQDGLRSRDAGFSTPLLLAKAHRLQRFQPSTDRHDSNPSARRAVVREGLSLRLLRGQMRRSDHRPSSMKNRPSTASRPWLTDDAFPMDENERPPAAVADAAAGLRSQRGARGCRNS